MIAMSPCPPAPARPTPWDHARDAVIDLDVPKAGRVAWEFIAAAMADWRLSDPAGNVRTVARELINNAIVHARRPVGWHLLPVRVERHPRSLVIEVGDADTEHMPVPRPRGGLAENGWGSAIVDALCSSTDVRCCDGIKTVRAAIALPDPRTGHTAAEVEMDEALDGDTADNVAAIRSAAHVATIAPPPGRDRTGAGTIAEAEAWLAGLAGGSHG